MRKKRLLFIAILISMFGPVSAQESKIVGQKKMKPFTWLVGNWKGSGWVMGVDGQKKSFTQKETIELLQNGTVITLKGIGMHGSDTTHLAYAVLYWDLFSDNYKFLAFTGDGRNTLSTAKEENQKLIWSLTMKDGRTMKYSIWKNEQNQWKETGEILQEKKPIIQFFEMILERE